MAALPGIVGDPRVVGERVVLLGVSTRTRSRKAGMRKILHVGPPRDVRALELVDEARRIDAAAGAVAVDPECRAARKGQVVGQRGMANGVHRSGHGVAAGEPVDERSGPRADNAPVLLVLHHDHRDTRGPGPLSRCDRGRINLHRRSAAGASAAEGHADRHYGDERRQCRPWPRRGHHAAMVVRHAKAQVNGL